jgi:phosphoglycolate phosphatase
VRRLIVFDLDGTLIDSRRDLAESANALLAAYAAPPLTLDDVTAMVGDGARKLVERVLATAGVDADPDSALARFLEIYAARLLNSTRPYPGIPAMLARLMTRASLAVLTNKPEAHTRTILEGLDLASCFRWVIGGDSPFPRKPDPAALLHLASLGASQPGDVLFVGDSPVDIETAHRAGITICAALFGFGHMRGQLQLDTGDLAAHDVPALEAVISRWVKAT